MPEVGKEIESFILNNFNNIMSNPNKGNHRDLIDMLVGRNMFKLIDTPEKGNLLISAIMNLSTEEKEDIMAKMLSENNPEDMKSIPAAKLHSACCASERLIALSILSKGTPPKIISQIINANSKQLIESPYIPNNPNTKILDRIIELLPVEGWGNEYSSKLFMVRLRNKPLDSFITAVARYYVNMTLASMLINASKNSKNVMLVKNIQNNNSLSMQIMKGFDSDPDKMITGLNSLITAISQKEMATQHLDEAIAMVVDSIKKIGSSTSFGKVIRYLFSISVFNNIFLNCNDITKKELAHFFMSEMDALNDEKKEKISKIIRIFLNEPVTTDIITSSLPLEFFQQLPMYEQDRKKVYEKLNYTFTEQTMATEEDNKGSNKTTNTTGDQYGDSLEELDLLEDLGLEENMKKNSKKNNYNWYIRSQMDQELLKESGVVNNFAMAVMVAVLLALTGSTIQNAIAKVKKDRNIELKEEDVQKALNNPTYRKKAEEIIERKENDVKYEKREGPKKDRMDYRKLQENIISRTLYAEARSEGRDGIMAVASVIFNRSNGTPESMVKEIRKPFQFSCWNGATEKDWNTIKEYDGATWELCENIAKNMVSGSFSPIINHNHYYNPDKADPSWAYVDKNKKQLRPFITIGRHRFLKAKNNIEFIKI